MKMYITNLRLGCNLGTSFFKTFKFIIMPNGNDKDKETPDKDKETKENSGRDSINKGADRQIKDADKQDKDTFGPKDQPSPKPSGG